MREGGLDAPTRHPIAWRDEDFYDSEKIDAELRRVFDICHGCRRCFNLCDSFPRLFDLIDESESGELDAVDSKGFKQVVDACTLCDMCFMTKCPYVPPHEFDLDFPHLMLRYRAAEFRAGEPGFIKRQLTETDRNGKMARFAAPIANWSSKCGNTLTRPALEAVAGVHRDAHLPKYHGKTFAARAKADPPQVDRTAPAFGRKALLYATCFINYNNPDIGVAAQSVLARNGVETEVFYPGCCGMPQLEYGDLARVAANAKRIAAEVRPWLDKGYDVVSLVPSCSLMMKFEWPLLEPDDENVKALSAAVYDASEYVVDIARKEGLAQGLKPLRRRQRAHRLPCPGAEHGRESRRDAAAAPRHRDQGDRALLRPRRLVGGDEGELRGGAEGRPAGRQAGAGQQARLRRLRVPARPRPHRPGHGEGRERAARRRAGCPSDPDHRPRLRLSAEGDAMTAKSEITRADIMPMEEYGRVRDDRRRTISAMKRARRVPVGPDTTFYFENYDTMLHQVHEMLYVEQGGEAQIEDELRAYNPLIPRGEALVATLMIEIDNPVRRAKALRELAGIETHIAMIIGDARVAAVSDDDAERTTPDGKTSSVHFLRFPFTPRADRGVQDGARPGHPRRRAPQLHAHDGSVGRDPPGPRRRLRLSPFSVTRGLVPRVHGGLDRRNECGDDGGDTLRRLDRRRSR